MAESMNDGSIKDVCVYNNLPNETKAHGSIIRSAKSVKSADLFHPFPEETDGDSRFSSLQLTSEPTANLNAALKPARSDFEFRISFGFRGPVLGFEHYLTKRTQLSLMKPLLICDPREFSTEKRTEFKVSPIDSYMGGWFSNSTQSGVMKWGAST